MSIIDRIGRVQAQFEAALGKRAKYLYLGDSELRELHEYAESITGEPASLGTGAMVGGMRVFEVVSASHMAVS